MKYHLTAACLIAFFLSLEISSIAAADESLKELKDRADKVLNDTDNVRASKAIAAVFDYANALEGSGQTDGALLYRERGLTFSPWRLDQQMAYARLLQSAGQTNAALERARIVYQRAETDELLGQSSAMLDSPLDRALPNEPWPEKVPSLALVPVGEVDVWLVRSLQTNLSARLRIPVVIKAVRVQVPPPKRNHLKMLADRCREPLKQFQINRQADNVARRLGLESSYKDDDEAVFKVFHELLRKEAEEKKDLDAVRRFDDELGWTRKLDKQWQAEELLKEISGATSGRKRPGNAFLAVTRFDLFAGESRYVFGLGDSTLNGALMSYLRFTSALMDQPADKERLTKRTLKQALSSVGFAFGVQRCSNPTCARSYPNSLEEHDSKGTDLCEVCRRGFEKVLQQK